MHRSVSGVQFAGRGVCISLHLYVSASWKEQKCRQSGRTPWDPGYGSCSYCTEYYISFSVKVVFTHPANTECEMGLSKVMVQFPLQKIKVDCLGTWSTLWVMHKNVRFNQWHKSKLKAACHPENDTISFLHFLWSMVQHIYPFFPPHDALQIQVTLWILFLFSAASYKFWIERDNHFSYTAIANTDRLQRKEVIKGMWLQS